MVEVSGGGMQYGVASVGLVVLVLGGCSDRTVRESDRATCKTSGEVIQLGITRAPEAIAKAKTIAPLVDTIQRRDLAQGAATLVTAAESVAVNAGGSWRSNDDFMLFSGAALDLSKLCVRYYP